jgi:hypothetical protein
LALNLIDSGHSEILGSSAPDFIEGMPVKIINRSKDLYIVIKKI